MTTTTETKNTSVAIDADVANEQAILMQNPVLAAELEKRKAKADTTPGAPARELKAHHIRPEVTVQDGKLFMCIPLEEIIKAKPNSQKQLGFQMDSFEFSIGGTSLRLGGAWHTLGFPRR
jgi:hypothetical protein